MHDPAEPLDQRAAMMAALSACQIWLEEYRYYLPGIALDNYVKVRENLAKGIHMAVMIVTSLDPEGYPYDTTWVTI